MIFLRNRGGPTGKKRSWRIWMLPVVLIVFAIAFFMVCSRLNVNTIYTGITVDEIDVGGLTRQEALSLLRKNFENTLPKDALLLKTPALQYRLPFKDIQYEPEYGKALDIAWQRGRDGNFIQRLSEIRKLNSVGLKIYPAMCYNRGKTIEIVESIRSEFEKKGKNAQVMIAGGKPHVTSHKNGLMLDTVLSLDRIEKSLMNRTLEDVELCVIEILPNITTQMLDNIAYKLAEFNTAFNPDNEGRAHNIRTACAKINQRLLLPGETFSMDKTLGDRTEANGYKTAKVIVNNQLVEGLGGGICQVTSTLYNTVLLSGMEVLERRNHTLPLSYIDPGRDATISEGYIDFKFRNNNGYAILLEAKVLENQLFIGIWGRVPVRRESFRIRTRVVEKTEPEDIEIIEDASLKAGEMKVIREAIPGYRVEVYRDRVDASGKVIQTEKISVDRYQPQKKTIHVTPSDMVKYLE